MHRPDEKTDISKGGSLLFYVSLILLIAVVGYAMSTLPQRG
jgi:hypothetical protein